MQMGIFYRQKSGSFTGNDTLKVKETPLAVNKVHKL